MGIVVCGCNTQIIIGLTTLRIEIKAQTLVWAIFFAIIPNKKLIYIHYSLLHLFSFIFQTEINNNEINYSVRNSSNFLLTAWCWVYLFSSAHWISSFRVKHFCTSLSTISSIWYNRLSIFMLNKIKSKEVLPFQLISETYLHHTSFVFIHTTDFKVYIIRLLYNY